MNRIDIGDFDYGIDIFYRELVYLLLASNLLVINDIFSFDYGDISYFK